MTTSSPAGTTTQRSRWRWGLAILSVAAAATIGLATVPALSASASPVAAKSAATVGRPAFASGTYTLYWSWGCNGRYGSVQQTFNANGTITSPGSGGRWVVQDGTLMWNYTAGPAIYAGNVDGPTATGMMTVFNGSSSGNGCWYLIGSVTSVNGPPPYNPSVSTTTGTPATTTGTAHHQHGLDETGNPLTITAG